MDYIYIYRVIEYADSEYDNKKIVICIYLLFFCLHATKSKQISKIIVARRSQGLYGVIEDADSEFDTKKNVICINLLFFDYM